jgi:hypothetical protein
LVKRPVAQGPPTSGGLSLASGLWERANYHHIDRTSGKVKKIDVPRGWNFSCFAAQLNEQDLF